MLKMEARTRFHGKNGTGPCAKLQQAQASACEMMSWTALPEGCGCHLKSWGRKGPGLSAGPAGFDDRVLGFREGAFSAQLD
ncbi:MAG: hypothetical protein ABIJ56_18305, partial [Pseudomonadota bacterium]